MLTSSGLGDHLVEGPRHDLFDKGFNGSTDWVASQDRFHAHRWLEHPKLSVCMSRTDASTVSRTIIELRSAHASLTYTPVIADHALPSTTAQLKLKDKAT